MSYIEIYKKYRPEKWSDLIGQEKTVNSLRVALKNDSVPLGYGFFGPRGCGKTSAALLLAKTLNCENIDSKQNPCNECDMCVGIENSSIQGVNYISMANQGSVADVDRIINQSNLSQPVKTKVWILDEAHNLSKAAWDRFLIPLEHKNDSLIFIFCSTESNKIPQTILSRIQSRTFNTVSASEMRKLLEKIISLENIDTNDDVIEDAIRQGRGSVRSTLTSFETLLSTGEAHVSHGGQLLTQIAKKSVSGSFKVIAQANNDGVDSRDLAEQLVEDLRNVLLISAGVEENLVGVVPVKNVDAVIKHLYSERGITLALKSVAAGITRMSYGADSRVHLEISIVETIDQLQRLRKALEAKKQNS